MRISYMRAIVRRNVTGHGVNRRPPFRVNPAVPGSPARVSGASQRGGPAAPAGRHEEPHRDREADDPDAHQDGPDDLDVDAGQVRGDGEAQDRPDRDEKETRPEAHGASLPGPGSGRTSMSSTPLRRGRSSAPCRPGPSPPTPRRTVSVGLEMRVSPSRSTASSAS